jgi:hypothetical protein
MMHYSQGIQNSEDYVDFVLQLPKSLNLSPYVVHF